MNKSLNDLITDLPEIYQSIYKHPEFSSSVSRVCNDRLIEITKIYKLLEKDLGRPLKVLDLGCAQGFFSLSLAQLGATVQGIDFLDKNIAVCNALREEHKDLLAKFNVGRIENILSELKENQYDLVLGLSVFHHLVYEHGLEVIQKMLSGLSKKIKVGIFELAISEEPLYWGSAQANPPVELLNGFLFVHEIKKYPTHLSHINRPLVVASNSYWVLDNNLERFDSCLTDSHSLAKGVHQGTRKYYFNSHVIAKQYKLNNRKLYADNIREYATEVKILNVLSKENQFPKLIAHGKDDEEAWIIRENIEGMLLLDKITHEEKYDSDTIIHDILEQCVKLEELGLYHNDLRTWNIIIDKKGNAKLIDFGAISTSPDDCIIPNNIFLAFYVLVKEIIEKNVVKPESIRNIDYDFDLLPEPYRSIFIKLFLLKSNSISFQKLLDFLDTPKREDIDMPMGFIIYSNSLQQVSSLSREGEVKVHEWWIKISELEVKASEAEVKASEAEAKASEAEVKASEAEVKASEAEAKASEAEFRTNDALHHYHMIVSSTSWKLTQPYRYIGDKTKWFYSNVRNWMRFGYGSRSRRVSKKIFLSVKHYIHTHPYLKRKFLYLLNYFPGLKTKLKQIGKANHVATAITQIDGTEQLSPRARKIYIDLEEAIESQKGNN